MPLISWKMSDWLSAHTQHFLLGLLCCNYWITNRSSHDQMRLCPFEMLSKKELIKQETEAAYSL